MDGELIAFSVLDLTPGCVSAVYFVYDPEHPTATFSLGRLSCMREIALAREGGYRYYYMGYHIPASQKMMYKSDFKPQAILDLCALEQNDEVRWDFVDDPGGDGSKGIRRLLDRDSAHVARQLPAYLLASRMRSLFKSFGREVPIESIQGNDQDFALAESVAQKAAVSSVLAGIDGRVPKGVPGCLSQKYLREHFDFESVRVLQPITKATQSDAEEVHGNGHSAIQYVVQGLTFPFCLS